MTISINFGAPLVKYGDDKKIALEELKDKLQRTSPLALHLPRILW